MTATTRLASTPTSTGFLIAVEGIDGAGKSTQIRALADVLRALGHEVVVSREPTYGQYGKQLRDSAASGRLTASEEHRLLLLDRREHVDTLIRPALERGAVVVLDRYYFSSMAYQGAAGLDPETIRRDNEAFAPKPDLLVIFDLPVEEGLKRIAARGERPNAFEATATLERCRTSFLAMLDLPFAQRVDATQDADQVRGALVAVVLRALGYRRFVGLGAIA